MGRAGRGPGVVDGRAVTHSSAAFTEKKKHRQTLDNIIICRKWFSNMMTSIGGRVLGPAQWYILGEIGTQML